MDRVSDKRVNLARRSADAQPDQHRLQRHIGDPRCGGTGDPRLRPIPDQPGDRIHSRRRAGRAVRAGHAGEPESLALLFHDLGRAFDRAVRRVRHHPVAVLDRARTVVQAAMGDAQAGFRGRRGRTRRRGSHPRGGALSDRAQHRRRDRPRPRARSVLDCFGDPDRRDHQRRRPRGVRDAAVRRSGAGADHLRIGCIGAFGR